MKALGIRQPYAWLIVQGIKDVENRSRQTHLRGPLVIHASKSVYVEDFEEVAEYRVDPETIPFGALVGVVDVVDSTTTPRSPWHYEGEHGWYLANPRRFAKPIPYKGAVGIMRVPLVVLGEDARLVR